MIRFELGILGSKNGHQTFPMKTANVSVRTDLYHACLNYHAEFWEFHAVDASCPMFVGQDVAKMQN